MFAKHQKKILFTTLALGYFAYRKALQHVIFSNQNVFLSQESIQDLKSNNYVYVGPNRVLIGSPLNNSYGSKKNRIVIIGGGLMGASTAYELSKNPENEVILLEKREDMGLETSYENGTFLAPSVCYSWVSISFMKKVFRSFFNSESPVKFSFNTFLEKYFFTWTINMYNNFTTNGVEEACRKLVFLGKENINEFKSLQKFKNEFSQLESTAKGTFCLYSSQESFDQSKKVRDIKVKMGIDLKSLGVDDTKQKDAFLKDVQSFKFSTLCEEDTNCDGLKLTRLLSTLAEKNGAKICLETDFQRFLVERSGNRVIGLITNNGTLLCDKVVVAAGYYSKNIIDLLGIRLPLLPVQGYSITIDNPKKAPLTHLIHEDAGLVHIAPLSNNKLRISGIADIGSVNEFDQNRLNLLVKASEKYMGPIDLSLGRHWLGIRPLTPDDVPIIGPIPGYLDIYLNTGHSSKGLTLCLGSAIALRNMLEGKDKEKLEKDYSINRFYLI